MAKMTDIICYCQKTLYSIFSAYLLTHPFHLEQKQNGLHMGKDLCQHKQYNV